MIKKEREMIWLHEPAVNPEVYDDLYPSIVVEDIICVHLDQHESVTRKSLYELCQRVMRVAVTSVLR